MLFYKDNRSKHPLYPSWHDMIQRCDVCTHKDYSDYGGRGIIVCDTWHDFWIYVAWCESQEWVKGDGSIIKRINTNGNFCSENCYRWYRDGRTNHPLYATWYDMLRRCDTPTHSHYNDYGGRGITVCKEWHNPWVFYAWAESHGWFKSCGLTNDRIDNNGNYCPENGRFATDKEQNNNRRHWDTTSNIKYISWNAREQKWQIAINGYYYGLFTILEEAKVACDIILLKITLAKEAKFVKNPVTGIFL